ncbi:SEC-C metal-binding domain-containing protein, partial [Sphingomonas sp.]|uniref:SEC-C metal-binding domain-containing protein n=1 Tax=Sphingomonas sp. TaxID=28214 RepID=UPI001DC882EF
LTNLGDLDAPLDFGSNDLGLVTTRLAPMPAPLGVADALGSDPAEWEGKISRNAACPCGSGKKYKHCHGALA